MNSTDPNTQQPTKRNTNVILGIIVVIFVAAIMLLLLGDGLQEAVDPDLDGETPVTLEATIDNEMEVEATEADMVESTAEPTPSG
ncbi:MAG: hypothetical protein CL607_11690 [Anaerolineaceae bacterium]|nr:hypothetical protein [Anaerolineaceae bacterium]